MLGTDWLHGEGKGATRFCMLTAAVWSFPDHLPTASTVFIKLISRCTSTPRTPKSCSNLFCVHIKCIYQYCLFFFLLDWNANCSSYIMQILLSTQIKRKGPWSAGSPVSSQDAWRATLRGRWPRHSLCSVCHHQATLL